VFWAVQVVVRLVSQGPAVHLDKEHQGKALQVQFGLETPVVVVVERLEREPLGLVDERFSAR
jgi:hypothetical protein